MMKALISNSVKAGLILVLMGSTSVLAQSGGWKLSEMNGQVSVGRQGATKIALRGQSLRAGDVIRTGVRSRAVVTRGDQYMVVAANSHIKIANPDTDGMITQVFNYLGNVLFKVDKRKAKHFGVETPYMAAVVKGTTFNVTVGAEGSTVQVTEGAVEVSTLDGGAVELLQPGMIGMVAEADPFAMTIIGNGTKRIESPHRGSVTPKSHVSKASVGSKSTNNNASKAMRAKPAVISQTITNKPVQLAALTNGLIEGQLSGLGSSGASSALVESNREQDTILATEDVVSLTFTEVVTNSGNSNAAAQGNGNAGQGNGGNGNADNAANGQSSNAAAQGNGNAGQGNSGNGNADNAANGQSSNAAAQGNGNAGQGNGGNGNADNAANGQSNAAAQDNGGNSNANSAANGQGSNAAAQGNGSGNGNDNGAISGQGNGNGDDNGQLGGNSAGNEENSAGSQRNGSRFWQRLREFGEQLKERYFPSD